MGIFLSLLFGVFPMLLFSWFVYWLDRYEKEPVRLLAFVFTWGAVVAAGGAFVINTILGVGLFLFTESQQFAELTTGSFIAPVVEESLKGFAVLGVYLIFRNEFDSILDGIIYAGIAALGFAATENTYYIYTQGYVQNGISGLLGMVFVRVILVGWQHPFYTAFIGIGLSASRLSTNIYWKWFLPFIGWCVAVLVHSFHNTLAGFLSGFAGLLIGAVTDWSGWLFMVFIILLAISKENKIISTYLSEEVTLGTISVTQYRTACSSWQRNQAHLSAVLKGNYAKVKTFYQNTAELAHKKRQLSHFGEEKGNSLIIHELRTILSELSTNI